jgi:predicted metal-binding protein
MTEVDDIADLEGTLSTRGSHEEITRQVGELLRAQGAEVYPLSTESCAICRKCAYPEGPCRHPEKMFPCVESHGILIIDTAERFGIDFQAGGNIVTWFSLILYR